MSFSEMRVKCNGCGKRMVVDFRLDGGLTMHSANCINCGSILTEVPGAIERIQEEIGRPVAISRSKDGGPHETFTMVDLDQPDEWPNSIPDDIADVLLQFARRELVAKGASEKNGSDGYRYRLIFD